MPGNLAGWCELLRSHGTKSLADVFAPAIALARDGFPLTEYNVSAISDTIAEFKGHYGFYDSWARTYTTGAQPSPGSVLRQPELARTLEAIASEGPHHLYGGKLGQALVAHVRSLDGCLTLGDLESAAPIWLDPLTAAYRDLAVHTLPPPCEGFQYLLTLRILDAFDLASMPRNGVDHLDTMYRAIRLAAGTRIAHNNPSADRLATLMSDGAVAAHQARVRDGAPIDSPTEQFVGTTQQHTTSFSVADADGNLVCITQSLGAKFGCGVVVPDYGVCLNNFLYWDEVDPRRQCAATGRQACPADGTEHRNVRRTTGAGVGHARQPSAPSRRRHRRWSSTSITVSACRTRSTRPAARLWDGRRVQVEMRIDAATSRRCANAATRRKPPRHGPRRLAACRVSRSIPRPA